MNKYLKCIGISTLANGATGFISHCIDASKVYAMHSVCKHDKIKHLEFNFSMIIGEFIVSALNSTLPAISAVVIDKLVHQNLTNNKAIQYTATAVESVMLSSMMIASQDFRIYLPGAQINGCKDKFWPTIKTQAFPNVSKFSLKDLKQAYNYLFTQEKLSIPKPPECGEGYLAKLKYAANFALYLGGLEKNVKNFELGIKTKLYVLSALFQSLSFKYILDTNEENASAVELQNIHSSNDELNSNLNSSELVNS